MRIKPGSRAGWRRAAADGSGQAGVCASVPDKAPVLTISN